MELDRRRSIRGQATIITFLLVLLVSGGVLWRYVGNFLFGLRRVNAGMTANQIATALSGRVRAALVHPGAACSPALQNSFSPFQNLNGASPTLFLNLGGLDCLLTPDEASSLSKAEISIQETSKDVNALWRKVRVSLTVITKGQKDNLPKNITRVLNLKIKVASLGYFGLVFYSPPSPALVEVSSGASVKILSSAFYADPDPVPVAKIYDLPVDPANAKLTFFQKFFVRGPHLEITGGENFDFARVETVFPKGIETNSLPDAAVTNFLPSAAAAWNQRFDYSFVYGASAFPLPETIFPDFPTGSSALVQCTSSGTAFQSARAAITVVPDAAKGIPSASATCGASTATIPLLVLPRASSSLTINLSSADPVFCGIIAADVLTIHLADSGDFAAYGFYFVKKLIVTGPAGAKLTIANPLEGFPTNPLLPVGQSAAAMTTQVKMLSSSTAYNFFLPITGAGIFPPATAQRLMDPCGTPALAYTIKSTIDPISTATATSAAFDQVRTNTPPTNAVYLLEDSL